MEVWDLYNERRELTGRDHIRGEEIPQGNYHLVVHIWIRNSKGEYLISQRSADRPTFPLMWECVGGSVIKGEDSITGALRETQEEVGLTLSPEGGELVYSELYNRFMAVFEQEKYLTYEVDVYLNEILTIYHLIQKTGQDLQIMLSKHFSMQRIDRFTSVI